MAYDFNGEQQTLFALDQPGPEMDPDAADRVLAAVEFFEENPDARTTISFINEWQGRTLYNLLGAVLLLDGVDLETIDPHDRFMVGAEILLEELGFSTFDFYALEEINRAALSPEHLRDLVEEYIAFPCRVEAELRDQKTTEW